MKTFSFLGVLAVALFAFASVPNAEAGNRGCGCCGTVAYAAPAAASPAAAATAPAAAVAQNQGYRSYSYQPGTAPAVNYSSGNNYYRSNRSNQPMWMNGGNKSLGRYN